MKSILLAAALVFAGSAWAQKVNVNDVDAGGNDESTTTIEIKKNKKEDKKKDVQWEVSENSADIESEPAATAKEAKAAWTKACKDWKKEVKDEAKENGNILISSNCGTSNCGGEVGQKTCTSKATYKIKTKLTE
jgi:hypothetical protein